MRIWAYTIVRNEQAMLPWWLRHYQAFCERCIVYDDQSDDATPDLVRTAGAELRPLPYTGLDDGEQAAFSSTCYHEARGQADFVIVVDADELLVGEISSRLTFPQVSGFQMAGGTLPDPATEPRQLWQIYPLGIADLDEGKPCVFRPELDVDFLPGRHRALQSWIDYGVDLKLLHYRSFGKRYALERDARNYERLPAAARTHNWGYTTYPEYREQLELQRATMLRAARRVV